MTKDPVCGMNVDENNAQYQTQYGGKKYSFCSQDCKTKFEKQPEQYARSAAWIGTKIKENSPGRMRPGLCVFDPSDGPLPAHERTCRI
jgi:YHS domain-containing protein